MLRQEGVPRRDWGAGLPGGRKVIREAAGVDPRVWVPPVQRGPVTSRASPGPSSLQGDGNPAADPPSRGFGTSQPGHIRGSVLQPGQTVETQVAGV